jgi:hypothetical protein
VQHDEGAATSLEENERCAADFGPFYRDGVSESQFKICVNEEVPQIRKAYRELGGDDGQLKITLIIVGKRHHTRFFPTQTSQSYPFGKEKRINGNLKPGLLVDSVTNVSIHDYSGVACFITDYVTGGYIFALYDRLINQPTSSSISSHTC